MFLIIEVFAIPYNFFLGFHNWNGFRPPEWVGLENYEILFDDPLFWNAVGNNFIFIAASLTIMMGLALFLALMLDSGMPGAGIFRIMLFLPVVTPSIVVGLAFSRVFSAQNGLLNQILDSVGLGALKADWLGNPDLALISVIGVFIWRWLGYGVILFGAALLDIPEDLKDAPATDGATTFQTVRYVIIPLIRPIILIVGIWYTILAIRVFTLVFILTNGGPFNASEVINTYLYKTVFTYNDLGLGSAMANLILLVLVVIALVRSYFTRRFSID
ncbi:MAG: sugar ABC transporter permease [Chloroflexi bacterium]|nr:sugar ABC transporter permease [Chloroflexota bacterium]